jgi:hypothetical protein
MRQNRVAQLRIGQPCNHCDLNRGHNYPSIHSESGEPKDPIAIDLNQRFQEAPPFRKSMRSQHSFHGDLEQTVWDALTLWGLAFALDGMVPMLLTSSVLCRPQGVETPCRQIHRSTEKMQCVCQVDAAFKRMIPLRR